MARPKRRPCFFCGSTTVAWDLDTAAMCDDCTDEEQQEGREQEKLTEEAIAQAYARMIAKNRGLIL